jgi:hypothetical protein
LNVKANGDIISTIMSGRDETVFASWIDTDRFLNPCDGQPRGTFTQQATFSAADKSEMIVSRRLES